MRVTGTPAERFESIGTVRLECTEGSSKREKSTNTGQSGLYSSLVFIEALYTAIRITPQTSCVSHYDTRLGVRELFRM